MKNKGYAKLGGGGRGTNKVIMWDVQVTYRPFPYSKNSHFQNEAKCKTFLVKTSFICMGIKTDFLIIGCALRLCLHRTGWLFVTTWMLSVIAWTLIRYVTLHFWDRRGAKSPFWRVNRSPLRYGFRAGARAIQRSVNDCEHSLNLALKRGLAQLGYGLWFKVYAFLFSY